MDSAPSPSQSPSSETTQRPAWSTLRGTLLDRVRSTWAEAAEASDAQHAPFLVAVGALAVYARACHVPLGDLIQMLDATLAAETPDSRGVIPRHYAMRRTVRRTARSNYFSAD